MAQPYFIDSHCHLHDREFFTASAATQILHRAQQHHVFQLLVIGTHHADSLAAKAFAATHPHAFWSYGIHPESATTPSELTAAAQLSADTLQHCVAIGEVGLDYHYQPYDRTAQIQLLEQMLELAQRHQLPLIFHVRAAFDDFWPIIDNTHVKHAVIHSFSDSVAHLEQALSRGFYIGVNGLATFAQIPLPPLERILLETDSPFLAPVPHRGHPNEPTYIPDIAQFLATRLSVSLEQVATQTTHNTRTLFQLPAFSAASPTPSTLSASLV